MKKYDFDKALSESVRNIVRGKMKDVRILLERQAKALKFQPEKRPPVQRSTEP